MVEVTCAILLFENKFLITQRSAESEHSLSWEFPGGKLKTGESPEDCIQREINEELEIEIEILERLKSIPFDYGFKKIRLIPFLCSATSIQLKLNEHIQFKWIQLQDIDDFDLLDADKKLIQHPENKAILEKYSGKQMDKTG
ncbi:(deoxy)nucleoside triphosphate pyrophosphohydrolase [Maribellus maritimus]|uniref:(deoxy)nucleoside triphosphate pyrophosphohydrolase n=1 Tax=Maribellus maritimus TaxID=2870838 RepID=UPI001EECD0E2|nr:NUDIX domain-containing protein [Maribellus maritimus]MCG6190122.1 NUDIX domain-containing protein [Maribellus maritimus]